MTIWNNLYSAVAFLGKLNPYSNPVGPPIASWPGSTIGKTRRSLRIHGLFGGKKENNDNGDDAPSKVL